MRKVVAARAVLALAGIAVVAWMAFGLRALDLQAEGRREAAAAGRPPSGPHLANALDLLRRAGVRNPDPRPQLDEAALLLAAGDSRAAARLLDGVVDRNPGSVRGWGLLAAAMAPFDERRSLQANGELLKLYGRNPEQLAAGAVRSTSGALYRIVPGHAIGVVDEVRRQGGDVLFKGWAGLPAQRRPVQEVLVVAHGRVLAAIHPNVGRPDIPQRNGGNGTGFRVAVAFSAVRDRDGRLDAYILGAGTGAASLLRIDCSRPQPIGC
jgi:hypothetical protein